MAMMWSVDFCAWLLNFARVCYLRLVECLLFGVGRLIDFLVCQSQRRTKKVVNLPVTPTLLHRPLTIRTVGKRLDNIQREIIIYQSSP